MPITRTRRSPSGLRTITTLTSTPDPIEARAANLESMTRWVLQVREIARSKSRADAEAFLMSWHDWLATQMDRLPSNTSGLAGLTAIDLANAQAALVARI